MQDPRLEMATNQARSENKRRQRQNIELLLLSIFTIAIDVVLIAIIVWLILKQGINSNTLAISSIIVAVIFGLSSLTFAYFQWRHPIHHEAQQHTYHPVLPPPTIPSNSPILPVSDANAQVTKFASFPSNGMILSKDALPPIWNVPYQRNPIFTDREAELEQLHNALGQDKQGILHQPQAVSGLGGIGKTQIGIEYAYRYHHEYQAVLWIRANSPDTFISDFISVAALLNLPESKMENQRIIVNAMNRWLQSHINWLLILDDVENWKMIREFVPSTNNGNIILTTRAQTTGATALLLGVDKMTIEEGALLLLRRTRAVGQDAQLTNTNEADLVVAKAITQVLDAIPLALDQAGAYIEETKCSLSDYLKLYQKHRLEILNFRGETALDHPESVAATWLLSFQRIEQINPASADLLRLCALLYPEEIPEEIISEGSTFLGPNLEPIAQDPLLLNNTIKELLKYSLLHRNSDTKTLTIHRLVQDVIKDHMDIDTKYRWTERAVKVMNIVFPGEPFETWQKCQRYLLHIEACANAIDELSIVSLEAAQLLDRAGSYLERRGQYTQAESFLARTLKIRERVLGEEHADTATSLNNLGLLYYTMGEYDQAEPFYQRALKIREKVLGLEHPDSILNLALLYYNQGKYDSAEPLYKQALAIYEQTLGTEHPQVATVLNDLAWLYHAWGKYNEAEPLYIRALQIRKETLGDEHPDVAQTYNAQAILYRALGNNVQAELLFNQALSIREKMLGDNHPDVATTLNDLAWLYSVQGKYTEAGLLYKRVLEIRKQRFGIAHPFVATALNDMAVLFVDQGLYSQAEQLFEQAFTIRQKTFGLENPRVASTIYNLASLQHILGKYNVSESLYLQALDIYNKLLVVDHPYIAKCYHGLASLYSDQEMYVEAEKLYRQALEIFRKTLGQEHRHVATVLNDMGKLYLEQEKYLEADALYQQALTIRKKVFGKEHPEIAATFTGLASLYYRQSQYTSAKERYQEARLIYEKTLGIDHPKVASALFGLAEIERVQGRYPEAELLYKKILEIYKQALRPDHPRIAMILESYAAVLHELNQEAEAKKLVANARAIRTENDRYSIIH